MKLCVLCVFLVAVIVGAGACGGGTEADNLGVGAQCEATDQCDEEIGLLCLPQFKGGYCGLSGCVDNLGCPEGSACVAHDDGMNYCFRICLDKSECNANRDLENEANCSSSITFTDPASSGLKACVPPSGS